MRDQARTDFGQRLFSSRKAAHLSQEKLAEAAGLSQSAVAELERVGQGSSSVTLLARACNVDPHWLATGEGDRMPAFCPLTRDIIRGIAALKPDQLAKLEAQLRIQLDLAPANVEPLRRVGNGA